jgi:hypothetical protein
MDVSCIAWREDSVHVYVCIHIRSRTHARTRAPKLVNPGLPIDTSGRAKVAEVVDGHVPILRACALLKSACHDKHVEALVSSLSGVAWMRHGSELYGVFGHLQVPCACCYPRWRAPL